MANQGIVDLDDDSPDLGRAFLEHVRRNTSLSPNGLSDYITSVERLDKRVRHQWCIGEEAGTPVGH
jgi:hypothetical protein